MEKSLSHGPDYSCPDCPLCDRARSSAEGDQVTARAKRVLEPTLPELWMICREDSSTFKTSPNPKKLYTSESDARRDATELCKQENKPFYLLKVVAMVRTTTPPTEWIE